MSRQLASALSDEVAKLASGSALPPARNVLREARRRRRTRLTVSATLAITALGLTAVAVPALIDRPDRVAQFGENAAGPAKPDGQSLHDAFAALSPPLDLTRITAVQPTSVAAGQFGVEGHTQSAGVDGENADRTVSVTWVVLTPALTAREVDQLARSIPGAAVSPVVTGRAQDDDVRSLVYRLDDGSFVRILAWSKDGGLASMTTGAGATTSDARLAEYEAALRLLVGSA